MKNKNGVGMTMEPGDKVRVKKSARQRLYRGRTGKVIYITGKTIDVEFNDEAVTHSFSPEDLELIGEK